MCIYYVGTNDIIFLGIYIYRTHTSSPLPPHARRYHHNHHHAHAHTINTATTCTDTPSDVCQVCPTSCSHRMANTGFASPLVTLPRCDEASDLTFARAIFLCERNGHDFVETRTYAYQLPWQALAMGHAFPWCHGHRLIATATPVYAVCVES